MVVFKEVRSKDIEKLLKYRFGTEKPKTVYEDARLFKKGVTLIHYTSGKLLLQGKSDQVDVIADQIRKMGIGTEVEKQRFRKQKGWFIGSDETLKGDTFGGLVVAGVRADDAIREKLIELGVADSKTLSDKEILFLARKIREIAPCEVRSVLPQEYNQHGKQTVMLNTLHKECAQYLGEGKHVVDKYPGCVVGDIIEEKADSKYVEVAAASILARAAGLEQLNYLSRLAGFPVPKGSSHVKLALHELQEKGLKPHEFVKTSFRNVKEELGLK